MARSTWHPYAPDQAFGHQAALDEELLDTTLARLERQRQQHAPRAGGKARPGGEGGARSISAPIDVTGWAVSAAGLPVTTNVALDAAARMRSEAH